MPILHKYIHPLTDFGFKKLFGTEANKDLLIDFLNQLLPQKHQIADVTFGKNEHQGHHQNNRIAVFDIFCKSLNGEHFIVEIQRKRQVNFKDRSIFYSTFPIHAHAKKGKDWDFKLPVIYTIAILDFTFDDYKEHTNFIHHIHLKDENGKVFYDKLNYIYIELPKFQKKLTELETHFDKWMFVLNWLNQLNNRPKELQERVFQKLFKIAEIAKYNKMERAQYEQNLKQYRDLNNVVTYAKEEGREEGREEQIIKSIQYSLQKGYPLEVIADVNRITLKQLKALIKKHNLDQ